MRKQYFHRFRTLLLPLITWTVTIAGTQTGISQERSTEPLPIAIWTKGVPGFESLSPSAEITEITESGERNVMNVNVPTVVPYLPNPTKSIGVAVVVAPGGGHSKLCIDHEGHNICQWLAEHGVSAYMLKYRLCREKNAFYTLEDHAVGDMERAIRWVRYQTKLSGSPPVPVGALGFSAGGELVFLAAQNDGSSQRLSYDEMERESGRPDFQCLIYPGKSHLIEPSNTTPQAFIACGMLDRKDISEGMAEAYLRYKRAGVSTELHIFSGAGHGFGYRSQMKGGVAKWPDRLMDWLHERVIPPKAQ